MLGFIINAAEGHLVYNCEDEKQTYSTSLWNVIQGYECIQLIN